MDSVRRPTSSRKWPNMRDAKFTLLPGQEKPKIRSLLGHLVRFGPAARTSSLLSSWMQQSFLLQWAAWFPLRCAPCGREDGLLAAESTSAIFHRFLTLSFGQHA